jgi:hypothetical protein
MKEPYGIRILKHLYSSYGNGIDINCMELLGVIYRELCEEMKDKEIHNPTNQTFGGLVLLRMTRIIRDLERSDFAKFSQEATKLGSSENGVGHRGLITLDNCQAITGNLTKAGFEYVSSIFSSDHINKIQENQNKLQIAQTKSQKRMEYATWILAFGCIGTIIIEIIKIISAHHC